MNSQNNNRPQSDRPRPQGQDRRPPQDRNNQNGDRKPGDRNPNANSNANSNHYNQRPRDQRGPEKSRNENQQTPRTQPAHSGPSNNAAPAAGASQNHGPRNDNQNRYPKNPAPSQNNTHIDNALKHIKPKRIETVEDIQADIERVEKDIQLEIKQIRAVKLGL